MEGPMALPDTGKNTKTKAIKLWNGLPRKKQPNPHPRARP
jgi:hypothetical protein